MAMEPIVFEIDIFDGKETIERSQDMLILLLEALVKWNVAFLLANPKTPLLYKSKVRYYFEPGKPDPWQDIPSTIRKGYGDCEDLACWRAAELRVRRVKAKAAIKWRKENGRTIYHVLVLHGDGKVEDPSVALGMHGKLIRQPVYLTGR